jgi:hypothetical protein
MRLFIHSAILLFIIAASFRCKNVDNVKPTTRISFIKVYEKASNYTATTAEPLSDGYIIGGNLTANLSYASVITKTDFSGNVIWEQTIPGSSVTSIKPVSDGYLILGDGIQANDTAQNINNQLVTQALLTKMDLSGNTIKSKSIFNAKSKFTDYHGLGLSFDASGNIVITGNSKGFLANAFITALVSSCDPVSLDTLWLKNYGYIDEDYADARNNFVLTNGNILWASSTQKSNQTQTRSYLTLSSAVPKSVFSNHSNFGQTLTNNRFVASEMQPSFADYGVIGTFSDTQGKNGNVFFIKADQAGNFIGSSLQFFDGTTGSVAIPADFEVAPVSQSDDVGRAICGTLDGGYLLGSSMSTTAQRGNGGLDINLIKIDLAGNVVWNKTFGGSGDETVNTIRALSDGTFLVAGGVSTNGLSAAFIMRVDKDGEIRN